MALGAPIGFRPPATASVVVLGSGSLPPGGPAPWHLARSLRPACPRTRTVRVRDVRRRWAYPASLSSALLVLLCSVAHAQSVRAIADTTFRSVVLLTMEDSNGLRVSTASGFFIRDDLVVTNFHAIKEGVRGHIKIVGARGAYVIAGVVGMDRNKDLAILRIAGVKAPSLGLGSDSDARVGDRVYAVGNPMGLEGTFSDGIISGIRSVGARRLLQITAPISPGSSGGPVLNESGLVIGIAVATLTEGQNLNFAIPASDLGPLLANVGRLFPLPGEAAITKPAPDVSKKERLTKTAADMVLASKNYRLALGRVLAIYQRDLARREELASLRVDLFERGVLSKREFEEGQRAQAEAQASVTETQQAIEVADRYLTEAEEVLKLTKSGKLEEAAEVMKSRQEHKILGTP